MCQQSSSGSVPHAKATSYGGMVSPRLVTVLQFCALCCLHVACQPCHAAHSNGHITPAHNEWSVMDEEEETNGTDTSDSDATYIENAKYALMPIIFVLTLGASILPWYIRRLARAIEVLQVGACFTAGVILGAGLSHLMPDAMEAWEEYQALANPDSEDEAYPMVPAVAAGVILLLVWTDALLVRRGMAGNGEHGHSHGSGFTPADNGHSHMVPALPEEYYAYERKLQAEKRERELAKKNYGSTAIALSPTGKPASSNNGAVTTTDGTTEGTKDEVTLHLPLPTPAPGDAPTIAASPDPSPHVIHVDSSSTPAHHGHSHGGGHVHTHANTNNGDSSGVIVAKPENVEALRGSKKQMAQAWIFLVALSVHSVFDGLSIGTEDDRDGFNALLVAIGAHKLLDGFALGVPIFFANWPTKYAFAALTFAALMTPFGIGVSMGAASATEGEKSVLTRAIVLAMSFGSFLFISLVELLPAGLDNGKNINYKMFACGLGWGLMALLAKYV